MIVIPVKEKKQRKKQQFFVDLVMSENTQDTWCVQSGLFALIQFLKTKAPHINKIILQSDNASSFNTRFHVEFIFQMNAINWKCSKKIKIARWVFPEPQCGKSMLDAHFSFVMLSINQYVDSGHDLLTPCDIHTALSSKAIKATSTILVQVRKVFPPGNKVTVPPFPFAGSRSTSDLLFKTSTVSVFEHSGIEESKIDLKSAPVETWRERYTALGVDFKRVAETKLVKIENNWVGWIQEDNEKNDESLSVSLTLESYATDRDRLISNFLQTFLTDQTKSFYDNLETITYSMNSENTSNCSLKPSWATKSQTTLSRIPLPDYVETKLEELVCQLYPLHI